MRNGRQSPDRWAAAAPPPCLLGLTNNSLMIIRENLSLTLEKLSLDYSEEMRLSGFLELKSMPRLKSIFFGDEEDGNNEDRNEAIENLRKQLPHLRIHVAHCHYILPYLF